MKHIVNNDDLDVKEETMADKNMRAYSEWMESGGFVNCRQGELYKCGVEEYTDYIKKNGLEDTFLQQMLFCARAVDNAGVPVTFNVCQYKGYANRPLLECIDSEVKGFAIAIEGAEYYHSLDGKCCCVTNADYTEVLYKTKGEETK